MLHYIISTLALAYTVSAHGYMISPNGLNGALGAVRGFGGSIDRLQGPGNPNDLCYSLPKSAITPLSLGGNGASFSVGLSISARHPGPCAMQLIDPASQKVVEIGSQLDCATQSPNSVRFDWTVKLKNMEQVTCKDCILRFVWKSSNLIPQENYQTCADVRLLTGGGGGGGAPAPAPPAQPNPPTQPPAAPPKPPTPPPVQPPVQPPTPQPPVVQPPTAPAPPVGKPSGPVKSANDCTKSGDYFCVQECGNALIQCTGVKTGISLAMGPGAVCLKGIMDLPRNC
ncbi:hypothetical protein BDR26DRAFT_849244 [Obelidium mucronatum]|nr:hypothetical protein BDR26DRAFT_849244 [Obelidium mucronatum]